MVLLAVIRNNVSNQMHNPPPEIQELVSFLSDIRPFSHLDNRALVLAARAMNTSYHRAGSAEQILDYQNPTLFIVRTGVFDVRDSSGELLDRVVEGGFFGFVSLLTGDSKGHRLHVYEDGLLYRLDQTTFLKLRNQSKEFDKFFVSAFERRLRVGLKRRNENTAWATKVSEVMAPMLYSVKRNDSILSTAQKMSELNIASIAILNDSGELAGIFTDKDCRDRVIAKQRSTSDLIETVMTRKPYTLGKDALVHEATLLMIRHQIKHLPIVEAGKPISMITLSDLIRLQRSDPVLIINEMHSAIDVEQLKSASSKIPELLLHLIKLDIRADDLGRILTSVTSTLTRRLISLAQSELGPEPVPFVWLAFGSQGRQDQSAKSDQDNGLLLDNSAKPEHDSYFEALAKFVNHGLDACGYIYCPGDIMAQNSQWRMSLADWQKVFDQWITSPSTKALMYASIFFDLRPIFVSNGAENLCERLQSKILKQAKGNQIFLSLMTQNALELTPPLGFFKQLIVDNNGEHKDTLDIKKRGMMPVTDIARIHALANGINAANTRERLNQLIEQQALNEKDAKNLLDAHEYIAHQRLLHQGEQLKRSQNPDNFLRPSSFSQLTMRHLKDAFKVVRDSQSGLKLRYLHNA